MLIAVLALVMTGNVSGAQSFLSESERAQLTPNPEVPGVMRHVTPGVDPGDYNKVLFGSVTLYFAESSKAKDIDADEAKAISDSMQAAVVEAVEGAGRMEIAEAPGPSTVLINVAITEINMQKKKRGLLGYTPVGLVATAAGELAGMTRMQLKDAKIEGELVDSVSGEVVAFFRVDEVPMKKGEKSRSWNDVTVIFEKLLEQGILASHK
jgi:hypothetical protein